MLISTAAVVVVGAYLSANVGQTLFSDRLNQVLAESDRSALAAQSTLNTSTGSDPIALGTLRFSAIKSATTTATNLSGYAMYCTPGNGDGCVLQDVFSGDDTARVITTRLRRAVQGTSAGQHWQAVSLPVSSDRSVPGIVVGSPLQVPTAGKYELYFLFSLADVETTLSRVQRAIWVAGLLLIVLTGATTFVVARLVTRPIRRTAQASEAVAAGDLERRLPEVGRDDVAILARSFNHMTESLQHQIGALDSLSRLQQRFVSDVSHELRTPLTTIKLASDVINEAKGQLQPPAARSAELLHTQVARFESLLADLLEISRLDAHAADLATTPVDLYVLARLVADGLADIAHQAHTDVHVLGQPNQVLVFGDERRLARIIRNLLANAIEHGEERPIEVKVGVRADDAVVSVCDQGVGLSADHSERVFDRFWRADPSRRRKLGGSGLGLAISREDARLHGGEITVLSALGQGATFTLRLPLNGPKRLDSDIL